MKTIQALGLVLITSLFLGCSTASYTIHVVDEQAQEIYVIYNKGADVKVGDVFAVYMTTQHESSGGSGGHDHGGGSSMQSQKHLMATVKVSKIIDEGTAEIKVVSGTVHNGATVEKLQ